MALRIIVFLILNFGALAIGSLFTQEGVPSEWYQNLAKAPWTPPGWVFGAAWATIMLCFSVYMAVAWKSVPNQKFLLLTFILQWILNVSWNPVFFYFQNSLAGLVIIASLTILITYFFFNYWSSLKLISLLLIPYIVWLFIATSLNAYILFKN